MGMGLLASAQDSAPPEVQDSAAPPGPPGVSDAAQPEEAAPLDPARPIRLCFKGATFEQVVEFFSRVTSLPVIWQSPSPEGTLDFVSEENYDLPGALRVLNIILQSKGVMLRVSDDMLYLQALDQMQKQDIPTFVGTLPSDPDITPEQIVTLVRPLKMAMAKPLAEKLASMVAAYGAVTAIEQSNSLVITETAANVQRLLTIIDQLDQDDPEGAVEVFTIRHARAAELMTPGGPLKALLSQKIEKFVINQQGQQVKIEEEQMPGLSISADERTNSIIAKGQQAKVDKLRQAIALLDVPSPGGGGVGALANRTIATHRVARTTPAVAAQRLNQLYQSVAERERPAVIALDDASKVMIIGSDAAVAEGGRLILELEGETAAEEPHMAVIVLEHASPAGVIAAINGLLDRQRQSTLKLVAGPDGQSIIAAGSSDDVEGVKAIVPLLDRQVAADQEVRVIAITNADASQLASNLEAVLSATSPGEVRPTIRVDGPSNSLLIRASDEQFNVIEQVVSRVDQAAYAASRQFRVLPVDASRASAEEIARVLQQMVEQTPAPGGGEGGTGGIEVITLDELIKRHREQEQEQPGASPAPPEESSSTLPLRTVLAAAIFAAIDDPEPSTRQTGVTIAVDEASNSLILLGSSRAVERLVGLVQQIQQQFPTAPSRIRVISVPQTVDVQALANSVNQVLDRFTPAGGQVGDVRRRSAVIAAPGAPGTPGGAGGALVIAANDADFKTIGDLIAAFASPDREIDAPIRAIPLQRADAGSVAAAMKQFFAERAQLRGGGAKVAAATVSIMAIDSSNTLLVAASEEDFAHIEEMVRQFDTAEAGAGLSFRVFQLQRARAADIERTVQQMVSDLIWSQPESIFFWQRPVTQPKKRDNISIRADPRLNALIVTGRGDKFDIVQQLIELLDAPTNDAPGGPGTSGGGRGIFIIDLQNISSETAKTIIETIGLDKPQPAGSTTRLVIEPIKVSLLSGAGRNAIIVVANPVDRETIVGLLKAIDSEPALAESHTQVIRLKHARAAALAQILNQVLRPADQQAETPLARAMKEQVRRLNVSSKPAGPEESGGSGGSGADGASFVLELAVPIRVIPDTSLNALVISSTKDNIAALSELISMFDQLPITEAVTVQMFPLQNISVEQFVRIVRDLFTQGKQLGRTTVTRIPGVPEGAVGPALLEEIAISVDERTNTAIVAGPESAVALVEAMRMKIDTGITAGWVEPRIVSLRYADAADLAATLQAIIVEGTTNLPQATPLQRQIGRLRMMRNQGTGIRERGAAADPLSLTPEPSVVEADVFVPMTRLVIRAEPQLNVLILVGTPDNLELVTELVAMLDIESASPADGVRIYPIQNASASRLATTVKQLFDQQVQTKAIRPEDRVIVQADDRTNALVVATSPRSFAVLEGMLNTLDHKIAPELREIRTIEVKNASAPRLATLVQQMMDARLERLRKVQPETADLERATVVADPRTNSLVIAAGNDTFDVIRRIAADLDVTTLGDTATVHVIPVTAGNADRLAQTINRLMERRYADLPAELRNSQRPLVLTDPPTNSLLIAASPEDLGTVQELVNKLAGAPTNPAVGLHVITLGPEVRAETMAPRVQRLMQERLQSLGAAGTPSDRVSVEADLASNSLIVAASDENFEAIRNLVEVLTVAAGAPGKQGPEGAIEQREVEIVTLRSSRAADLVDLLDDLYVREAIRTRGAGAVRVTSDDRLNAVVINAPANDVRAIRDLIAQLDGAKPATVVEIKYVPLQSANALETVSLIENVLRGRGLGDRRNPRQATVLKYLREMVKEAGEAPEDDGQLVEMEVSAAVRESITLTPDLRTNTIIVSAPRESVVMIERMIRDLDASSTGSKNIRIFKLINADALAMAEILTDLFSIRRANNLYVLKPREDEPLAALRGSETVNAPGEGPSVAPAAFDASGGGIAGTELSAVPDERQQLAITVDSRTNSLIVSGTPTYLDLVEQVVSELDSLQATERDVYVYQLRNAVAEEVARVVGGFVEQEQKKLISTLGADQIGSAARLLEREITIQGDVQSNTVLVSASPRYMDRVKEMISKLDVDPPQVLIQVMLAEVTLDSRDEWGVNLRAMAEIGSVSVTGGYGLAKGFVSGLGVPNLAIASSDFDLLIRAMQSQGRLQVLSNPSIMAANNSPARIQVGETIQVPTSSSISNAGNVFSTVSSEDIGVILEVTPSINPDGFVRMTINPEISNLSNRTTQISEDFSSPIITRRRADTTVTVHDGQTIVLGGLMSDRFEKRDRKVPVLGDIPLVGKLFRADVEETATTELLIVLTPHVIASPAEFTRVNELTQAEIDRLSVPQNVKDNIRRGILEGTGGLYDASGNRIDVKEEK
jgi:type II secretion system protein D